MHETDERNERSVTFPQCCLSMQSLDLSGNHFSMPVITRLAARRAIEEAAASNDTPPTQSAAAAPNAAAARLPIDRIDTPELLQRADLDQGFSLIGKDLTQGGGPFVVPLQALREVPAHGYALEQGATNGPVDDLAKSLIHWRFRSLSG